MAIWYTDYLIGDDTTGDGSIALPYKTITKAMTIGTNGDEVRVAGSGFTALDGTITATTVTGTTWDTSANLTGTLFPGDIITLDDKEFGDQKFFYKVQTVGATSITVDGYWNRTPNGVYTLSKIATQHYYTTATNVTFENIASLPTKTDFKITGGWVDAYTAQTGWTVMNYHGGTSTAKSGTGFTAPQGGLTGAVYLDKFMLSHLNVAVAGSINRWYQGTFALVYFGSISSFGGNSTTLHPYGPADFYLTNSNRITAYGSNAAVDGEYPSQYRNVYQSAGIVSPILSSLPAKITNMYFKSVAGTGLVSSNSTCGNFVNVDNIFIQTQQPIGNMENVTLIGTGCSVNNDIQIVGDNAAYASLALSGSTSFSGINLPTKKIEDYKLFSRGDLFANVAAGVRIKDMEGDKQGFNLSNIAFADSTVFDTGSNSLRLSKTFSDQASRMPINVFFNEDAVAKTITIRAKASAAVNATFNLNSNSIMLFTTMTETGISYRPQVFALTTDWQDLVYTGLDAAAASILLKSWVSINVITDTAADYIWIDSVIVS